MIDAIFKGEEKIYRFIYADKALTEKLITENDKNDGFYADNKQEYDDNGIKWLPLTKQNVLDLVPKSDYCYSGFKDTYKCCPFWTILKEFPKQMNGYCTLMEVGDFMSSDNNGSLMLWDQTKECGINPAEERDYFSSNEEYQKFLDKCQNLE